MCWDTSSSCVSAVQKARLPRRPIIICNDLTPAARRYLLSDTVDVVVDEAFEQESQKSVLALHSILRSRRKPFKEIIYTDSRILTREMVEEKQV